LLGHTSVELGFWEDPRDRELLIERLGNGALVDGSRPRLRLMPGIHSCLYSAEIIDLEGQPCLFLATEERSDHIRKYSH
jgi:hypothetical protein